jgi:alkylation response protein AidB-like acyl-CoA dehydrogenase
MHTEIEAARMLAKAAWDKRSRYTMTYSVLWLNSLCEHYGARCNQIMVETVKEYHVERTMCKNAKITQIYEGTSEIQMKRRTKTHTKTPTTFLSRYDRTG